MESQSLDEIKTNLIGYIYDLNYILRKNTRLQLRFNPDKDVIVNDHQTNYYLVDGHEYNFCGTNDYILPSNFSIAVGIIKTTTFSNGGSTCQHQNQGAMNGLKWVRFYSRSEIKASTINELQIYDDYYRGQLVTMAHELAHILGAGDGDYYNLNMKDETGVSPTLDVSFNYPSGFYWRSRQNVFNDPLLGAGSTHGKDLLNQLLYSQLTVDTIHARLDKNKKGPVSFFDGKEFRDSEIVKVVSKNSLGQNISGCVISAYRQTPLDGESGYLIDQKKTDSNGEVTFDIKHELYGVQNKNFVLFKTNCSYYDVQAGDALSRFDLDSHYYFKGGTNGEFHFNGTLILIPTCSVDAHLENGSCVRNIQTCSSKQLPANSLDANKTWIGSSYSKCKATRCIAGYIKDKGSCTSGCQQQSVRWNVNGRACEGSSPAGGLKVNSHVVIKNLQPGFSGEAQFWCRLVNKQKIMVQEGGYVCK